MISKFLSQITLLGLIAFSILIFVITLGDPAQETYLAIYSIAVIGFALVAERMFPLHREWNHDDGDTIGDVGSFIVIFGVLDSLLKWVSPFVILALLPAAPFTLGLPLAVEIILATMMIELAAWISHWAHHRYPSLWALHAMHHSPERLYTLNNFRFHPLNHILNHAVMILPPLALGVSPEALLGYMAISLPVLLLQHSNIRFDFGNLSLLLNTNAVHRWHHSSSPQEGTRNLGRALVLFDQLFETFYLPAGRDEPKKIGLFASSKSFPKARHLIAQIMWPLNPACCR